MKLLTVMVLCIIASVFTESNFRSRRKVDCDDNLPDDIVTALTHLGNILTNLEDNISEIVDYALQTSPLAVRYLKILLNQINVSLDSVLDNPDSMTSSNTKDQLTILTNELISSVDNVVSYKPGEKYACIASEGNAGKMFQELLNEINMDNLEYKEAEMRRLITFLIRSDTYVDAYLS